MDDAQQPTQARQAAHSSKGGQWQAHQGAITDKGKRTSNGRRAATHPGSPSCPQQQRRPVAGTVRRHPKLRQADVKWTTRSNPPRLAKLPTAAKAASGRRIKAPSKTKASGRQMDDTQQPTQARQAAHSSKAASGRRIKAPSQTKASGRQMDNAQQPTQARQAAHSSKGGQWQAHQGAITDKGKRTSNGRRAATHPGSPSCPQQQRWPVAGASRRHHRQRQADVKWTTRSNPPRLAKLRTAARWPVAGASRRHHRQRQADVKWTTRSNPPRLAKLPTAAKAASGRRSQGAIKDRSKRTSNGRRAATHPGSPSCPQQQGGQRQAHQGAITDKG